LVLTRPWRREKDEIDTVINSRDETWKSFGFDAEVGTRVDAKLGGMGANQ